MLIGIIALGINLTEVKAEEVTAPVTTAPQETTTAPETTTPTVTTPQENERSRYLLYLNDNGKKKLNKIIDTLTGIRDNFDSPANNDAFYGKVDCLLQELEALMENYQNTK